MLHSIPPICSENTETETVRFDVKGCDQAQTKSSPLSRVHKTFEYGFLNTLAGMDKSDGSRRDRTDQHCCIGSDDPGTLSFGRNSE